MPLQCSGVLRHCCGIRISGQHAKRTGRHAFAVADYSSPFLVSAGGRKCPTGAPRRQELGFTGEDLDDFEEIARMLGREKVRVRSFNGSVLCDHGVLGVEAWVTNAHVRGPPFCSREHIAVYRRHATAYADGSLGELREAGRPWVSTEGQFRLLQCCIDTSSTTSGSWPSPCSPTRAPSAWTCLGLGCRCSSCGWCFAGPARLTDARAHGHVHRCVRLVIWQPSHTTQTALDRCSRKVPAAVPLRGRQGVVQVPGWTAGNGGVGSAIAPCCSS